MTIWTDERVEQLKAGVARQLSYGQIADQLACGLSRNACIGKAARLGLVKARAPSVGRVMRRRTRSASSMDQHIVARIKAPAMATDLPELPPEPPSTAHKIHFMSADNHQCHFPMWGDNTQFTDKFYCGSPTASVLDGIPYCSFHSRIAFTPAREPKPQPYWPERMRKVG